METQQLPIIDMSLPEEEVAKALRHAAETVGFFYLKNHGIEEEEFDRLFDAFKRFFASDMENKMGIHTSKTGGVRGYIGKYEQGNYGIDSTDLRAQEVKDHELSLERKHSTDSVNSNTNVPKGDDGLPMDLKELFTMGTELTDTYQYYKPTLFAKNVFPQQPADFKQVVCGYYERVWGVARRVFALFALSMGLPREFFEDKITKPMNSMNCIHYPPYAGRDPKQLGIGAHTDYECFTLLAQDGVLGLEIFTEAGVWRGVPPIRGAFVVNIGDMMARWTNGRFRSTVHRARNPNAMDRYSCAYFCCCDYDVMLKPLIDADHPRFTEVMAGDHLLQRIERANVYTGEDKQ
eukprot:GDKI01015382.1.p1 GENE.GDKI01015382.1~~GDKI01015382.1.p1  ORF type:complete len:348 (-),score=85.78 GDKI01015382.1:23-1066(-)